MGLAGNKKKTKLSTDPNNTAWSKSTTSFGHKILSKQGWTPGSYLGAENASHSSHYTAANASHIRVLLREDNLGLGAKIGTQNAETFGLSMFSGLLGRLNGKEEDQIELSKKEETLRDVQLKLKYGQMNFVKGGLLVGDKMCEVQTDLGHLKEGSKKRKASDGEHEDVESIKAAKKRRKQKKKANGTAAVIKEMKRKRKQEAGAEISDTSEQDAADSSSSSSSSEDEKAAKRRSEKSNRKADKDSSKSTSIVKAEKARLKEEKRARKAERRKRKEEKRARRAAREASKDKDSKTSASAAASEAEAATASAPTSGTSTPTFMGGRQAVRHRYIMQKRMAAGSAQALKEIFMMKPQVAS